MSKDLEESYHFDQGVDFTLVCSLEVVIDLDPITSTLVISQVDFHHKSPKKRDDSVLQNPYDDVGKTLRFESRLEIICLGMHGVLSLFCMMRCRRLCLDVLWSM